MSKFRKVIAIAAAHHRLLWIHPFLDGNGRVARLMAHAMFRRLGIGSGLWAVSRGLARNSTEYKSLLMAADRSRENDYDGRGNLSEPALAAFCEFFLRVSLDQIRFMQSILDPRTCCGASNCTAAMRARRANCRAAHTPSCERPCCKDRSNAERCPAWSVCGNERRAILRRTCYRSVCWFRRALVRRCASGSPSTRSSVGFLPFTPPRQVEVGHASGRPR